MPLISTKEKIFILLWIIFNLKNFDDNVISQNRKYLSFKKYNKIPKIFKKIKKRIIERENLFKLNYMEDPFFGDFISIVSKNGYIHEHTDPTVPGFEHVRYNLCIFKPSLGGETFYNNKKINVKENFYVKCYVKEPHRSNAVLSLKPRITISYGFLLPID